MRTTVTLTPQAESLVKRAMKENDRSFRDVVNDAIVEALTPSANQARAETPVFDLGEPRVDIVHTGRVLAELDNEHFLSSTGPEL
jgi:hypothetical protein